MMCYVTANHWETLVNGPTNIIFVSHYILSRYFEIDDAECTFPGKIEGVTYFDYASKSHQPMQGKFFGAYSLAFVVML